MSEVQLADALARLEEHHALHLPLRKRDLLGRLALRFLWRRHLKWQMDVNLAIRDAVQSVQEIARAQEARLGPIAASIGDGSGLVTSDQLNHELGVLRQGDQSIVAGLNQRIYAAIGGIRREISDVRLQLTDRVETSSELELRLKAVEGELTKLASAARDLALRQVQFDLLADQLRRPAVEQDNAGVAVPERGAFIELATMELLDGTVDQARVRRLPYLPVVETARGAQRTGSVFDMLPGRGEWLEALRTSGIPAESASPNPYVVRHCATLGFDIEERDPLAALAARDRHSLAAITGFRYVERTDPSSLAQFVELAAATLRQGGVLIVETPLVRSASAGDFHLDPFAQRPVHPEFLRFLVVAAGFADVEIRHVADGPLDTWQTERPEFAESRSDRYCLVAWR